MDNDLLREKDWLSLVRAIELGKCTPIIGPGICGAMYANIANTLAYDCSYPFEDKSNLAQVSQYIFQENLNSYELGIMLNRFLDHEYMKDLPDDVIDIPEINKLHSLLASLPFPIYLSTNYDSFLVEALRKANRNPKIVFCQWNDYLLHNRYPYFNLDSDFRPSITVPIVFYIHGYHEAAESLVVTEDNILDFFWNLASAEALIPTQIREALSTTSILFIGYNSRDLLFKMLLKWITKTVRSEELNPHQLHIANHLQPEDFHWYEIKHHFEEYYARKGIHIYWGNTADFIKRLNKKLEQTGLSYSSVSQFQEIPVEIPLKKDSAIKILFLVANPNDTTRLKLDAELRSIDESLRQSEFRDRIETISHGAVRVIDLQYLLMRHKPNIVHFSGHGTVTNEIVLEDTFGQSAPVAVNALSQLFNILKDNIKCVVLNACYSEEQAEAIAQHIDCVIGMSEAISENAAITFAATFYGAIGFGRDIKTAFDLGCVQIHLENLNEQDMPKLIALRKNPKDIVLVRSK